MDAPRPAAPSARRVFLRVLEDLAAAGPDRHRCLEAFAFSCGLVEDQPP